MPEKTLHVELIAHTPLPEQVCALGAKLCYAKADVAALRERVSAQDQSMFLERIMESGHLSVLEHASFSFAVEGISRVLLADHPSEEAMLALALAFAREQTAS